MQPAHYPPLHPLSEAPFFANVSLDHDVLTVRVGGELDLATRSELENSLEPYKGRYRTIAYDLELISFIDCSGLSTLLAPADGRVTLTTASPSVRRLLELLGLNDILPPEQ